MKSSFYDRCLALRNFYIKRETDSTKLILLSKLVALSFYNQEKVIDDLPKGKTLEIDCSDLTACAPKVEDSLSQVLYDLEFTKFDIGHNKNYNLFHKIDFWIKE